MDDSLTRRSATDMSRILEERAHLPARPLLAQEPSDTIEMVVMALGPERYGVDSRQVREVLSLADLAPVPGISAFWSGIVNVRGTLYAVIDLRRYLSLAADETTDGPNTVVLVSGAQFTIGLGVDDALGIRRVRASDVGPSLAGTAWIEGQIVRGITDDLLTVLDVDALVADSALHVREELI